MSRFFPYQRDRRFEALLRPLGVRLDRDGVSLTDDGQLIATYGRFRLVTPLANVGGAHVTGPYRWWKSVGLRLSFADDGVTFGTGPGPGACVHFHERARRVAGLRDHSALTVTVADPDALVEALGDVERGA